MWVQLKDSTADSEAALKELSETLPDYELACANGGSRGKRVERQLGADLQEAQRIHKEEVLKSVI